jgi:YD repeat-containing protein
MRGSMAVIWFALQRGPQMYVWPSFATILLVALSPAWFVLAQQSSQTGASMSDRDKAGLRGPVKTVVDEQTFSMSDGQQRLSTNTTEYTPDGKILEVRTRPQDGSEWVTNYTYHSDGRLLKTVFGKLGSAPGYETTYSYDEARRLIALKSGDNNRIRYHYDDKGRKSVIESYDSKPLSANTAYATHWEGTDLGFAPYPGGTLSTSYNEEGVATGAQLKDKDGKLVAHILRKFDAQGRITSEEQVADAPELMISDELRSTLNPEQAKSVGAFVAGGMHNRAISYFYDTHGHVKERHRSDGVFGEEVTITTYNDHGDIELERTTTVMNPEAGREYDLTEAGAMIPVGQPQAAQPPATNEAQYSYQYDSYGNWTEQTTVVRSRPDAQWEPRSILRRKLTYY